MSLERIDPILREDLYCVDHLLRYALGIPLCKGKRVLDAACGVGFGAVLLARQRAKEVVGLDNSEDGIRLCQERWELENLRFVCQDLESLEAGETGSFDLITSFETLEHVKDPARVLSQFKQVLNEGGVLLGSVPGKTDRYEDNAFHLHYFDEDSLRSVLADHFQNVAIFGQSFSVRSAIHPMNEVPAPEPLKKEHEEGMKIDFGKGRVEEDSLVFLASDGELPSLDSCQAASSRAAWRRHRMEYLTCMKELDSFSKKYESLFLEHGDLKVKFANVLGWGKWHFQQHSGESPSGTAMDRVVNAMSEREAGLREQIKDLREDNRNLRVELDRAKAVLTSAEKDGLVAFNKGVDNI